MGILEFLHERLCPVLNYAFDITNDSVNIYNPWVSRVFNEEELDEESYAYIYIELVKECLKAMNPKIRVVVKQNIANSNIDLETIENMYVNSLSKKEQQLYMDTVIAGMNSPYLNCNKCENFDYNIYALCVGKIKVFIIGDKLKVKLSWNKFSTISSMVPFYLIFALKQRLLDLGITEEQFNHVISENLIFG